MERKVLITGEQPAYGKEANTLISKMDLGTNGVFKRFSKIATLTLDDNIDDVRLSRQLPAIKAAFESEGCINVEVKCLGFEDSKNA